MKWKIIFRYIFFGLIFLSLDHADVQWRDKQGNIVKPSNSMKSKDGFGVQLLSVDEKSFFKVWNTPSETVDIDVIDTIHKNTELIFPILFGGCKTDKNYTCHIVSDFLILAPDGSRYTDIKQMHIFDAKPYPNHALNVSNEYIKIIIEKKDLLGEYKVKAHVTDTIRKIDLDVERVFTVVDDNITIKKKNKKLAEPYKPTKADMHVSKWMTYAYKNGYEDDKNNIIHMLHSRLFTENRRSLLLMAVFMSERFKMHDSYLITHQNEFSNLKGNALEMLLFALKQANTKNSNILYKKVLNNMNNKTFLEYIKSVKPLNILDKEIKEPSQIDVLWASFMASGKKEYVEKIIILLKLPEEGVNNLLLLGSAKWSLLSNAQQHEKVLKICQEYKSKNKSIRKHLDEILTKVKENEQ